MDNFQEKFLKYYKEHIKIPFINSDISDVVRYIYTFIFNKIPYTYVRITEKRKSYIYDNNVMYNTLLSKYEHFDMTSSITIIYSMKEELIVIAHMYSRPQQDDSKCNGITIFSNRNREDLIYYKAPKTLFGLVTYNGKCFETKDLELKDPNFDVCDNYNDDIPIDKIDKFITSKESGLVIFHGTCGTGKSYFIRHLVYKYGTKKFLFMDSSCFSMISNSAFIDFLYNNKDSVIILEDCEELLKDRGSSRTNSLSALLNMSDGMLGDSLNLKFICTFNCDLSKLDSAILRKGRLKIKYEFKPLCKEKADKLIAKLGKKSEGSVKLCDIYNAEDNGGEMKRKQIGF